jgi:hypothetical protein
VARFARASLAGLVLMAVAGALSSCGASNSLGSDVLAPLTALPATDVILETNLQTAVQAGIVQTGLSGTSSGPTTSGPPTSPGVVSAASATGVSVYTAFNPADRHCLGTFILAPGSLLTVLGQSAPGTYDFWFGPTSAVKCTASMFTTESAVPSGWASGDPSSGGWPSA